MKTMNRNSWVAVGVAIVVVGFFLFGGTVMNFFNGGRGAKELSMVEKQNTMDEELVLADAVVGTGEEAVAGSLVTVHYVGRFPDGTVFDSSLERGTPFTFVLGQKQVIEGWDKGFVGMKVGGRRTIIVPPHLGYGANDYGPIPGNSTLIFDVELLGVVKPQ